jgi:hypothetical protein
MFSQECYQKCKSSEMLQYAGQQLMTDVSNDRSASTLSFKTLIITYTLAQCHVHTGTMSRTHWHNVNLNRLYQAFVFSFLGLTYRADVQRVLFVLRALDVLLHTKCASLSHFSANDGQRGTGPPARHSSSYNCFDTLLVVTLV